MIQDQQLLTPFEPLYGCPCSFAMEASETWSLLITLGIRKNLLLRQRTVPLSIAQSLIAEKHQVKAGSRENNC